MSKQNVECKVLQCIFSLVAWELDICICQFEYVLNLSFYKTWYVNKATVYKFTFTWFEDSYNIFSYVCCVWTTPLTSQAKELQTPLLYHFKHNYFYIIWRSCLFRSRIHPSDYIPSRAYDLTLFNTLGYAISTPDS